MYFVFLSAAALVVARLFTLQIRDHSEFLARAESQQKRSTIVDAERGQILMLDRDGTAHPVAINKQFPYVYIIPADITDPSKVADGLAATVGVPRDVIFRRASKEGDPHEMIARRISEEAIRKISDLQLEGVHFGIERLRFYPMVGVAADTIGIARESEEGGLEGKYGVEAAYDQFLRGRPGTQLDIRGGAGNAFLRFQKSLPQRGADVVLTIDPNVQFRAEELIAGAAREWNARNGTIIAANAKTGEILALANWPTFNPNERFSPEKNLRVLINEAIATRFEPGSVFKSITKAAALEAGAITPETVYNDTGRIAIGNHVIGNFDQRAHGEVTMSVAHQRSLNVGAVITANALGSERFREFLAHVFRLEDLTGVDLPGEVRGDLSGLWPPNARPINFATASFGQGVAVSPIKLVQIFGSFANGGTLLQPRIVRGVHHSGGGEELSKPKVIQERILSERALRDLTEMMVATVEDGGGRRARIPGYSVAGKTGTAQIPSPAGGYSDETIHAFVAFTPYTDPPIVVLVKLERPIGVRFSERSVVPAARDLLRFILEYYSIFPDKPENMR